jgi:hypothetical protein
MVCVQQMDSTGTSQEGDNTPNPPPFPPTLVEAIATLVNVTTLLAQNHNGNQGHRGRNNGGETTYVDFTNTRPPVFSKVDEPLEADDWLRTMEQKFELLQCTEYQKPVFAAQQLRGAAGVWWANLVAARPAGHRVTWQEFCDAFRAHYIPDGVMAMKLEEFLSLKQGNQTVLQYVGKFNHLSQYATEYVNTDAKKKSYFMRGLSTRIQEALVTCYNATYHEIVNVAIASEEKSRLHKESKKKNQVFSSPSGGIKKR